MPGAIKADPTLNRIRTSEERPRVVRIIARLNIGGPAIHVAHLSEGLAQMWPTVLVTGLVGSGEGDMLTAVADCGVRLEVVPELGRSVRPWHDIAALLRLIALMRRYRPEIVHTHTAKAGTLGRIAAVITRVPVRVHTFHGHVLRGYFGPLATRATIATERLLARFSTRIVTVSETQADELANEFGICPRGKIEVIPLGLDLAPFAPEEIVSKRGQLRSELGITDGHVVAIVGRLVPIKNHALFLRMAGRLLGSGRRCAFLIVGGGEEEAQLRRLSDELGIADSVHFLGWRHDLARIYADSDVVVLTSDNEGTPVSVIEALASGCAVVATDVGGVRDVLDDGRLGMLTPSGDVEALTAAVARLLDDPASRSAAGRYGPVEMPQRFGRERLLGDMSRLYERLVSRAGLRSSAVGAQQLS